MTRPLPELHITMKFNHDGTYAGATGWSWRNGRCSRNGMVVNPQHTGRHAAHRAVALAEDAFELWLAEGGARVVE